MQPTGRTLDLALITLGDPGQLTGGYLFHQRMAERAAQNGASLRFIPVPVRRPFPLAVIHGPSVLRQADGYDALVLDSIAAAFLGPRLLVHRPRHPLVGMLHQPPGGIDAGPPRMWLQARLDRMAYWHAACLLVASESLADDLASAGVPRERLRVVPPGRDGPTGDGPEREHATGPNEPVGDLRRGRPAALLCVANWLPQKDILSVLEAVAKLPDAAVTLHLVGDTQVDPRYTARVRARLARHDLAGRVVAHGRVAPASVAAYYAAADAFVLAARHETYGTVYGEAMAAGLPVVGWRAGNLPYLAQDGREGLLVAPGDIAGLADALRRVAEDAELRSRLGAAARERARMLPTWDDSASLFFQTIREVVGGAECQTTVDC
jgi:glycosyltransferase involved in cell wall biosynthesis